MLNCTESEGLVAFAIVSVFYATVVGGMLLCSGSIKQRFHEFATEAALERQRQSEMIERLLMQCEDAEETE